MKYPILIIFMVNLSISQWGDIIKITPDSHYTNTSHNSKSIAVKDNVVYIVWGDYQLFSGIIYFKKSTDNGYTWQPEKQISDITDEIYLPSISVNNNDIHVVWQSDQGKIYYTRSNNGGSNWDSSSIIAGINTRASLPSITAEGQILHVLWNQSNDVYYRRSINSGDTWEPEIRLTNDPGFSYAPSLCSQNQYVYISWSDEADDNEEIFFKMSSDNGTTWGNSVCLTKSTGYSQWPSITASLKEVCIVWHDSRSRASEIYFKKSTNQGSTWSEDKKLTNAYSICWSPSLAIYNSVYHVAWKDHREGNFEIYYKRSTNWGKSWGNDIRITNNNNWSDNPSLAVSDSFVHLIWDDEPNGLSGVYYRHNPKGNEIGLITVEPGIPENYILYQNFPNPFNPATTIKFGITTPEMVKLSIYDATGKEIAILVNENLEPGIYSIEYDAAMLSSGIYYYSINAGNFSQSKKMIVLK